MLQGCSYPQMEAPVGKEKPGAVGLSFYFYKAHPDGEKEIFDNVSLTRVYLSEVGKGGKPVKSVELQKNQVIYLGFSQVVVSGLDSRKKYALRSVAFTVKFGKQYTTWEVEPSFAQSAQAAPIQIKNGQFQFAGVIGVEVHMKPILGGLGEEATKVLIRNDHKTLANMSEAGLWGGYATWAKQAVFGYEKKYTLDAAKRDILEAFERSQEHPYWKGLAQRSMK